MDLMTNYVGILDGQGKAWGIRIPDLPGCYGGGATPDAAIEDAMSATREWLAHRAAKGEGAFKARSLAQILKSGELDRASGEAAVIIPAVMDAGRTVRANLTLDAGLLEAIDAEARRRGLTRSAFLASAARERLGLERRQNRR
jgi:predicted RNase H-like HicB family nuclease